MKVNKEEILSKLNIKLKSMSNKDLLALCEDLDYNPWTNKTDKCDCCCNQEVQNCIKCDGHKYMDYPF